MHAGKASKPIQKADLTSPLRYQYTSLGPADQLDLSTPTSSGISASSAPFVNAPQTSYSTLGDFRSRSQHMPSLPGVPQPRPNRQMAAINVSVTANASAPTLRSPSPGNSSDGESSPGTPPPSAIKQEYGPHNNQDSEPHIGFPDLTSVLVLKCEGQEVKPDIHAKIDKNLFFRDKRWTCYRRNYLFVECSYSLAPCIPGAPISVETKEGKRMVQALGVKLAAVMDEGSGKDVGLVQQTPKRDRGPQLPVRVEKLAPTQPGETPMTYTTGGTSPNSPYLPLQMDDPSKTTSAPPTGSHTFERIQFKQATANNGRRRAQQQFYHLLVELHADVRKSGDNKEHWIKVAHRCSEPMVVRGRSPGHYKDSLSSPGASHGGSGGGFGQPGPSYGQSGSGLPYSLPSPSQARGSMSGASTSGGTYFHTHTVPSTPGWSSNVSMKSPMSSTMSSTMEPKTETFMTEQEAHEFDTADGYRFFPWAITNGPSQEGGARTSPKFEQAGSGETGGFANANPSWPGFMATCSRFQGLDTSHGYYSDVKAAF